MDVIDSRAGVNRPTLPAGPEAQPSAGTRLRLGEFLRSLRTHTWPIVVTAVIVVTGMAFMLYWPSVVEHKNGWLTGGDMWGIFRAAHYVGWGFFGGIYDPTTGVNSLPGLEIVLAPLAMLSSHLQLTESFPPFFLPHPTVALILEPIELLLASSVLFAADALARHLEVSPIRRRSLAIVVGILAWPTVAIWGHAEDCLALALAIYALVACLKGQWRRCGWIFGFAIVMQPLVVMLLPLLIGTSPAGKRLMTAIRSLSLTVVLVVIAFASDATDAYRSLIQQPTPPSINHATPWASIAPHVRNVFSSPDRYSSLSVHAGKYVQGSIVARAHAVVLVSGGAGRAIEALLAVLIGIYAWRRPQSPERLIWLAAAALGMRCMFEAVMTPYYLAPPLILIAALAACRSARRFWAAIAISFEISLFAYQNLSPWAWWLPVVTGMAAVLMLAYPNGRRDEPTGPCLPDVEGTSDEPHGLSGSEERAPAADQELQPVS